MPVLARVAVIAVVLVAVGALVGEIARPGRARQTAVAPVQPHPQAAPVALKTLPAPVVVTPAQPTATVAMKRLEYAPGRTTVHVGETVEWLNRDAVPHTVTADASPVSSQVGPFSSPALTPGSSYRLRFNLAGSYQYVCTIHPTMVGVIVVAG